MYILGQQEPLQTKMLGMNRSAPRTLGMRKFALRMLGMNRCLYMKKGVFMFVSNAKHLCLTLVLV